MNSVLDIVLLYVEYSICNFIIRSSAAAVFVQMVSLCNHWLLL